MNENEKNEALEGTGTPPADNPPQETPEQRIAAILREKYPALIPLLQDQGEQQEAAPPATVDFTKDPAAAAFIQSAVTKGIQDALKGKAPRANVTSVTEQERKSFDSMSYKERLKLHQTDPETYNKLAKGA